MRVLCYYLELSPLVVLGWVGISIPHLHHPHAAILVRQPHLPHLADGVHHLQEGVLVHLVADVLAEDEEGGMVS